MLRTSPLFKGDCEISQLFCIFQVLGKSKTCFISNLFSSGTPNETLWPGVSSLSNYTSDFPQWQPTSSLSKHVHLINDKAEDILTRCLSYIPEQRLTTKQALQHPYFLQESP
jgi:serine/threonine protein kinase